MHLAKQLAKQYGTEHYEFEVSTTNFDEKLSEIVYQYDEPFADAAMIPLYFLAKEASQFSKVVLQGDGGDELFAGYGRHLELQHFRKRKTIYFVLKNFGLTSKMRKSYSDRFSRIHHKSIDELFANLVERDVRIKPSDFFKVEDKSLLNSTFPLKLYNQNCEKFKSLDLMQRMLFVDMTTILPNKYLEKVDKINMLNSIEARVPLLDNELVDYVMCLTQSFKLRKNTTKYLLRDVLKGIVPNEILNDRKKSFGTPILNWLSTDLYAFAKHQFELAQSKRTPLYFKEIINELEQMKTGKFSIHSKMVWKFLVLSIWINRYNGKIKF